MVLEGGTSKTWLSVSVLWQPELLVAPQDVECTRTGKGQCSLSTVIRDAV